MDGSRSLVSANELMLYGVVDPYAFEGEGIRAIDVIDSLQAIQGNQVKVRINSPGGSVTEGLAIYNALLADGRKIVVQVDAMAASIASIIAMAGNEIIMAENASMMIHDPWTVVVGSSEELRKMANEIDRMRNIIVDIYANRTGKNANEIQQLMASETYMSASDAVDMGFATSVDMPLQIAACAPLDKAAMAKLLLANITNSVAEKPAPSIAAPAALTEGKVTMTDDTKAGTVAAEPIMNAAPAVDVDAIRAEAAKAERDRVSQISAEVRRARLDMSLAEKLVADGVSVDMARKHIIDAIADRDEPRSGGNIVNVHVLQDETATRREAMTEALALRLGCKGEPSAAARQYMEHSIVDMAAERVGHRGYLGVAAKRENVLRMAMHTTSDFPVILEDSMNKALAARYMVSAPTYRNIARQRSYMDFRAHDSIRAGDFPTLSEVNEAGEIIAGTVSEKKESTRVKAYGIQLAFSRQLLVNDGLGGLQSVLNSRADTVAAFEEATFFAMMLSASAAGPTLVETSRGVFNTTDKTKASSGAAISITTLGDGRAAMRAKTSLDGLKLNIGPSILLVGPAYETLAQQYVAQIVPNAGSSVNPFSGSLRVVVTAHITGNAWYLFADPAMGANFEWGLLDGYTAPRFRMEEPFGVQGMRVSLEHDFGCGAIDYRFGWLNAGG